MRRGTRYFLLHEIIAIIVLICVVLIISAQQQHASQQTVTNDDIPEYVLSEHTLPILLLETEPENLWSEETGIYYNFEESGDSWERPATLTFFDTEQNAGFRKKVGIRIHGSGTRSNPQKSFRIYADYERHTGVIRYPIFPEHDYSQYGTLLLRAGGGDWAKSYIRDVVTQRVALSGTSLDAQNARPAVLYLNGEYWGLYYIRERLDHHYLENKYGLDPSKLSIIQIPLNAGEDRGTAILDYGSNEHAVDRYNELLSQSKNCTTCAHISSFEPFIDIDNFVEYYFVELYADNADWPYNNSKIWRYRQPKPTDASSFLAIDGRFRWLLFDMDAGLGATAETASVAAQKAHGNPYHKFVDSEFPFRNLFYDPSIQQRYLTRTTELLNQEFSALATTAIIENTVAEIEAEMPRQLARWHGAGNPIGQTPPETLTEWEEEVSRITAYVTERPEGIFAATVKHFDLEDTEQLTVQTVPLGAGTITIGKITVPLHDTPWTGTFFPDTYMAFEAHSAPGYRFDHWEGDVSAEEQDQQRVVLKLAERETITAVFRKRKWYEILRILK